MLLSVYPSSFSLLFLSLPLFPSFLSPPPFLFLLLTLAILARIPTGAPPRSANPEKKRKTP